MGVLLYICCIFKLLTILFIDVYYIHFLLIGKCFFILFFNMLCASLNFFVSLLVSLRFCVRRTLFVSLWTKGTPLLVFFFWILWNILEKLFCRILMNGFCQILNSDTTERWYYFLHLHTNHKRRFHYPANLFKCNSRNTRKKYEISSKLTIKTFFIVFLLLARLLSLYHAIVSSVDLDIQIWIFKSLACTQLIFTSSNSTIETLEPKCEICLKLTIKTPERRHWRQRTTSSLFIVFLLLILNK